MSVKGGSTVVRIVSRRRQTLYARLSPSAVSVRVLQKCHFKLRNELNVPILLPHLNQYRLITADFHEQLMLPATHAAKVDKLVAELPRSGTDFLERFIQCLRDSVEEEPGTSHGQLADAIEEELKIQATRGFVCSTQITLTSFYENASPSTPLLVRTSQSGKEDEGQKSTKTTHCSRWWYCCYAIISVVIILLAVLLIILSQEPPISPSVYPQYAYHNSTVELLFDHTAFLDHIAVGMNNICGAKLYQIQDQDCRTLPLTTSYVDHQADFIYMLPGSTIHFTITPGTSGQIWIFSDYPTLNRYSIDHSHFDCLSPPSGAFCIEAQDHPGNYPHAITQPAYYFITFSSVSTAKGVQWHINRTIFDIERISNQYHDIYIGLLTPDYTLIYFPFPYKKSCVLVNFPTGKCIYAKIQAANAERQELYLIFPAIPLVICVIILIVLVGVHVYCHSRRKHQFSFEKIN